MGFMDRKKPKFCCAAADFPGLRTKCRHIGRSTEQSIPCKTLRKDLLSDGVKAVVANSNRAGATKVNTSLNANLLCETSSLRYLTHVMNLQASHVVSR